MPWLAGRSPSFLLSKDNHPYYWSMALHEDVRHVRAHGVWATILSNNHASDHPRGVFKHYDLLNRGVVTKQKCPFYPWFFILDVCSFNYAHTWSKSGISICWRHLVTLKESSNPIFFRRKTLFTSYVRNMKWTAI